MKEHFSLLDPLRFFAAFWVMNFHYLFNQSGELEWYRYGNLGVQLFFIISGFVIMGSLNKKSTKDFATGRFLRLYPIFWIICTGTYIITLLMPNTVTSTFTEYLRSMTMFGDLFNHIVGYTRLIDPSYWTLTVELLFYIFIGIFAYIFGAKNIRYFFVGWFVFSVVSFIYGIDHNFFVKLLLVRHASYFIFGGSLYLLITKKAENIRQKLVDFGLLFSSAIYATYIHPRALEPYYTVNLLDTNIITLLHIAFFIMVVVLVYLSPKVKNLQVLKFFTILGGITYPLYLLHQKLGNTFINYFSARTEISWSHLSILFELFIICFSYFVYLKDLKLRRWLKEMLFGETKRAS